MRFGSIIKVNAGLAALLLLAGCRGGPPRAPGIGEAYVGPAVLNVRGDIPMESKTAATVKHGERLEILQRRRKFLKVRTAGGAEGWVSENQLLSSADMTRLNELAERAAKMPAQGVATSFGDLNVHTQPNAHAPSFVVIRNGEKFTVLAHLMAPRTDPRRTALIPPAPKRAPAKKPERDSKYPSVPMPKPPGPPADWLALSKTGLPAGDTSETEEAKPLPTDNWSLVRTSSGQTGWVLTRRLFMAIPDEVAQYAEGHRIVSYFPLGWVEDGGQKKDIWLWTTISSSGEAYDFDSFRVFVWSLKRHRYETAYIEKNLKGYAPVLLKQVDYGRTGPSRRAAAPAQYPGFSICEEKRDGQRRRREYAVLTNVVRFAGEYPCEAAAPLEIAQASAAEEPAAPAGRPAPREGLAQRFRKKVKALTRRWFGG